VREYILERLNLEPQNEPDHVKVDEPHRASKPSDRVGHSVLETGDPLFRVAGQAWMVRARHFPQCQRVLFRRSIGWEAVWLTVADAASTPVAYSARGEPVKHSQEAAALRPEPPLLTREAEGRAGG
jgi:hypothetical protein